MKKRILSMALALLFSFSLLTGCGEKKEETKGSAIEEEAAAVTESSGGEASGGTSGGSGSLVVATNPGVHEEILTLAAEILEKQGIILEIQPFNDYVTPNFLLDGGSVDANYFQHEAYLNDFNLRQDMNLASAGKVHFEPLGIYPGTKKTLKELSEGDVILIPEDRTNMGRALELLQNVSLITLKDDGTEGAYELTDIGENPYGLSIVPMEASRIPAESGNAALLVINGNFARSAFLDVEKDSLAYENASAPEAEPYWNVVAVRSGSENDERIKALMEVLQGDEVRNYINSTYNGAFVAEQ